MPGQRAGALLELLDGGVERPSRCRRRGAPPRSRRPCRPRSRGRGPITPPAPQPTSSLGRERLVDGLEQRLGRDQVRAGGEHDREVARLAAEARPRGRAPPRAPPRAASRGVERPVPIRTDIAHRRYSAPCRGPPPSSRSSGRPGSARPRWRSRSPSGCAPQGEDPVAISADALQLYAGWRSSPARRAPPSASGSSTGCVGTLPLDRDLQRRASSPRAAHAEIDALLAAGTAADRRRRHRPLPARGARRARPAPAGRARRSAPGAARSWSSAARPPCTRELAAPRARGRRGDPPGRRPAGHPRARAARRRPGAAARHRGLAAVDGRRCATRRCSPASTMDREALVARIEARVDAMVAAGAEDEVRAADAAGASARRPPGARLPGAARRRRRGDEGRRRAATPSASSPGCASSRT